MISVALLLVAALGAAPTKPCKPAAETETVRLDFDGAPVHDLAREVGRLLCKNFVLDPKIAKMQIFVLSGAETRAADLWPAFLHILKVNDLTLIDHANHHAIIMAVDATRATVPSYGSKEVVPPGDRMVTKIIELKGRDLVETTNFLNIFKTPQGQLHPLSSAGVLVMTDFASSLARLEWLLSETARPGK